MRDQPTKNRLDSYWGQKKDKNLDQYRHIRLLPRTSLPTVPADSACPESDPPGHSVGLCGCGKSYRLPVIVHPRFVGGAHPYVRRVLQALEG